MAEERMVFRYFHYDVSFDTTCDRILYDALEGKKVARADWADPANRDPEYGGGMDETFGRDRDLQERVPESRCRIPLSERHSFHLKWAESYYGPESERRSGGWW